MLTERCGLSSVGDIPRDVVLTGGGGAGKSSVKSSADGLKQAAYMINPTAQSGNGNPITLQF